MQAQVGKRALLPIPHKAGAGMIDSPDLEMTRQGFRYLNRCMVLMWRMGMGKLLNMGPAELGRYMVLGHTGRKSGMLRRTPVNYAIVEGELYCVAGFGRCSDWFRNIMAHPEVEIWLPDGWWAGEATEMVNSAQRLELVRAVLFGSGFAARMAGVNPHTISDEELDRLTSDYALVHIRRTHARTGNDGPGDLAWLWLPLAFVLGAMIGRRSSKQKH